MQQILAPVVFNRHLTGDYWLLDIEAPSIARDHSRVSTEA